MGKIISFQPYISSSLLEEKIAKIKDELCKDSLSEKKLQKLEKEIIGLTGSLSQEMAREIELTSSLVFGFISKQAELSNLIFNCHTKCVDKKVDRLTCRAQHLAHEVCSEKALLERKILKIKKSIELLFDQEALSLENRQMINLAKDFLSAASQHKVFSTKEKQANELRLHIRETHQEKDYATLGEVSLNLFAMAGQIYELNCKEALMEFMALPQEVQEAIHALAENNGISLELLSKPEFTESWKKGRYILMQCLIGYSHQLLEGSFQELSFDEIDEMFADLRAALKEHVV